MSYERIGGVQDTDDNAADFQAAKPSNPQNFAGAGGAGRPGAVGDRLRPGQQRQQRRSQHEHPDHVLRAGDGSDAAFSLTCGGTRGRARPSRARATPSTCSTRRRTLPVGASCTIRVEGDLYTDTDTNDPPDTGTDFSATFTTTGVEGLRIHDIQGRQHLSPYRNTIVAGVPGVVTATRFNGFYVQDPQPDRDTRTSEGIFVFTGSPVPAAAVVGAAVTVSGRVTEFRQGCTPTCAAPDFPAGNFGSSSYPNLTITEIDRATVTAAGTGTITPTIVGRGGREIPDTVIDDDTPDPQRDDPPLITGNVEDKSSAPGDTVNQDPTFDPWEDGIDFYESLEGMLTQINKAVVVEPTNVFSAGAANENSEFAVLADGGKDAGPLSDRGVIIARGYDRWPPQDYRKGDFNPERIILNDPVARDNDLGELPEAQVGDRYDKPLTAVVDYAFGNFKFLVRDVPPIVRGKLTPERAESGRQGRPVDRVLQRREPRPGQRRRAHAGDRAPDHRQPALAGHRRAERDAGPRRRGPARPGRRPDVPGARRGDQRRGRAELPVPPDRPGPQRGRRGAEREHPRRLPVQPGAGAVRRPRRAARR